MACMKFRLFRRWRPSATTATRNTALLERLPQELLFHIASILRHGNTDDKFAMADLASLCLVSRKLCIIARDQLYKNPYIGRSFITGNGFCVHSKVFLFARTMVKQPSLFTGLQHLSIFLTEGVLKSRFNSPSEPVLFIEQCLDRLEMLRGTYPGVSAEWINKFKRKCPEHYYAAVILALAPPIFKLTLRLDEATDSLETCPMKEVPLLGFQWSKTHPRNPSPLRTRAWRFLDSKFFTGPMSQTDKITTLELNNESLDYLNNWEGPPVSQVAKIVIHTSVWVFLNFLSLGSGTDPLRRLQRLFSNCNALEMTIDSCHAYLGDGSVVRVNGTEWRFKHLMIRLRALADRLEHLSIKVNKHPREEEIDKWLPKIRRVGSLRHYKRLRSLVVPQDFFFKRSLKPHVLQSVSICSLIPQSLERLEITYPSKSILVFLDRLAQWLECHSTWKLREIVLSYSHMLGDMHEELVSESIYGNLARCGVSVRFRNLG